MSSTFSPRSFVLARLLLEPIYREDSALWDVLRAEREAVVHFFRQIGQDVVIDEGEGYAFLRQIESEDEERVPRIGSTQPLSYHATLLLVCVREELARFDSLPSASTRLVLSRSQLRQLVGPFLPETNDQKRDLRAIDSAIRRLGALKLLRAVGPEQDESYEVMRILKARFGSGELEAVKERLARGTIRETDE